MVERTEEWLTGKELVQQLQTLEKDTGKKNVFVDYPVLGIFNSKVVGMYSVNGKNLIRTEKEDGGVFMINEFVEGIVWRIEESR